MSYVLIYLQRTLFRTQFTKRETLLHTLHHKIFILRRGGLPPFRLHGIIVYVNNYIDVHPVDSITVLKRTANAIFEHGGVIRKIENLGTRPTPFKISAHGLVHKEAGFFVYKFDFPPAKLKILDDGLTRDVDIIRKRVYKVLPEESFECTLEEEIKPAPYRKEVQEMIEAAKRKKTRTMKFTIGNNQKFNPFQK